MENRMEVGGISHANRKFYEIPSASGSEISENSNVVSEGPTQEGLLSLIREGVVGKDKTFSGPFGLRKVEYCDFTASGRSLSFLEKYIQEQVLPDYGNTHTTTTVTSLQTTLFRHEARDIVRNAVKASEHDAVIFAGSGCTGAVHKLIHALNFEKPPVVFVGPYEHHSNLLPWRELGATVVQINETSEGLVDIDSLDKELQKYENDSREMVGCFSAASNVTGILVDTTAITIALHKRGALAFWDYATAGPHVTIDMNPVVDSKQQPFAYKDAIFISTHKFVGGVQTPGILVAKKKMFRNRVPAGCGGGSVFFVRREGHRYLQEAEMREEGGTPAIVESIRAGLVFQLKEALTSSTIMCREEVLCRRALKTWKPLGETLNILGNTDVARLPIFSFLIRHPASGLYLHHNYVCAILNDVFGIQARGGCACAGPYAEELLGIDECLAKEIEEVLVEDSRLDRVHLRRYREYSQAEILRPGFVRLNLPFFMTDEAADFVIQAVAMVAEHGWKLLPQYKFNPETGEWRQRNHQVFKDRKWLGHISYNSGQMRWRDPPCPVKGPLPSGYQDCLDKAKLLFEDSLKVRVKLGDQTLSFDERTSKLRWFLLPSESYDILHTGRSKVRIKPPFTVVTYPRGNTAVPRTLEGSKYVQNRTLSGEPENVETFHREIDKSNSDNKRALEDQSNDDKTDTKAAKLDSSLLESTKSTTSKEQLCPTPELNRTFICEDNSCFIKRKANASDDPELQTRKYRWHNPPKLVFKPTVQALEDFDMIRDGDRVLVCLSGGKDSLSLLHTLHQVQFPFKKKGINFELGAVTVDPQTSAYDPSPLKGYLRQLNVPYFYEEQNILEAAADIDPASICSFCSRMKRGRIYHAARREKYNVLAMGQHLDDLSESFLMSVFQNGILRTMKANYTVKEEDLRVIRPFVYVREKHLRQFAEEKKLPVIAENCPACFEAPKERHRMKQLLASQELLHARMFPNILSAIKPIMAINKTGVNARAILAQFASKEHDDSDEDL